MITPAVREPESPLEAVLRTWTPYWQISWSPPTSSMLPCRRDREQLEFITRLQEALSSRLERYEGKRISLLAGQSLEAAFARCPRRKPSAW